MAHTYTSDLATASPDHAACEERVRFLAEQCAELLEDLERIRTHRDRVLRQLVQLRAETWGLAS